MGLAWSGDVRGVKVPVWGLTTGEPDRVEMYEARVHPSPRPGQGYKVCRCPSLAAGYVSCRRWSPRHDWNIVAPSLLRPPRGIAQTAQLDLSVVSKAASRRGRPTRKKGSTNRSLEEDQTHSTPVFFRLLPFG